MCSDCFTDEPFTHLLGPPYSLRQNNIEIKPLSNPTMASECSSERTGHPSVTLNEKLARFSSLRKAWWELRQAESKASCAKQLANFWTQRKGSWRKLKVLLYRTPEWQKAKWPYCWYAGHFSGLDSSNQPQHPLKPKPHPEQGPTSLQFCEGWERGGRKVWN